MLPDERPRALGSDQVMLNSENALSATLGDRFIGRPVTCDLHPTLALHLPSNAGRHQPRIWQHPSSSSRSRAFADDFVISVFVTKVKALFLIPGDRRHTAGRACQPTGQCKSTLARAYSTASEALTERYSPSPRYSGVKGSHNTNHDSPHPTSPVIPKQAR